MTPNGYNQACAVAAALDVVGDRWTLLVLRDLLGGPARFVELERGLPGIAPNLLTGRLRRLQDADLVAKVEADHGVTVYALTDLGEQTRPILEALGRLGVAIGGPDPTTARRPASHRGLAIGLQTLLGAGRSDEADRAIGLQVDDQWFSIALVDGGVTVTYGRPDRADATVACPYETVRDLLVYRAPAERLGAEATGDREAIDVLVGMIDRAHTAMRPADAER